MNIVTGLAGLNLGTLKLRVGINSWVLRERYGAAAVSFYVGAGIMWEKGQVSTPLG